MSRNLIFKNPCMKDLFGVVISNKYSKHQTSEKHNLITNYVHTKIILFFVYRSPPANNASKCLVRINV